MNEHAEQLRQIASQILTPNNSNGAALFRYAADAIYERDALGAQLNTEKELRLVAEKYFRDLVSFLEGKTPDTYALHVKTTADKILTGNQFEKGVIAMARNTLPVAELLRSGEWGVGDLELWLKAVINNDADYLDKINSRIHSTVKGEVEK